MKAKLFRNGHIVSGKIAEVLINKGKAESVDEPEVLVTEAIVEEPEVTIDELVEPVEQPEVIKVSEIPEKVIVPKEKPVKKQKAVIQKIEPKVRKKRTVKVKK